METVPVTRPLRALVGSVLFLLIVFGAAAAAQESADCLGCHGDRSLTTVRAGKTVSLFVDEKKLSGSAHEKEKCVGCHVGLAGKELPHDENVGKVSCAGCHAKEVEQHEQSLHGRVRAKGGTVAALAPTCIDCHGPRHEILRVSDRRSPVLPARVPFLCGRCHREGSPVQRQFDIPQDRILENFSESMHGEALLKKGLTVAATCASCHTAHLVLPHTDPRSSIARRNIAATCTKCHSQIEEVHRKIIRGELWEREANVLPACVDCHQPHKVRKVFYDEGLADADCMTCHARKDLKARDGRAMFVDTTDLVRSRHAAKRCAQCHSEVRPERKGRPCASISHRVDCGSCHPDAVAQFKTSVHGKLADRGDANAPTCRDCHGTHRVLGRKDSASATFARNVPALCAQCHREGKKAAIRYQGDQHQIIEHYQESAHGKGLLSSGLLVTAMCTDCHTAHRILPFNDPDSSVNARHLPDTCGRCHHGIEEKFQTSIHATLVGKTKKALPVCNDCHTAHTIRRADTAGFRIEVMATCGKCHEDVSKTYFETYHGKVSQLGYAKTAKCYDCHGAHDILPVADIRSHLSRENVVATCQKCHPGATRRFAGYLTHATHHEPAKYPFLFWTFWGMTGLLVGTFVIGGAHTLLWLPRALQLRKEHAAEGLVHDARERQFIRFSRLERGMHIAMIVSFLNLALTGMTLKFSYMPWAGTISRLFGGFETAGNVHRMSAVLMFAIFITHVVDLIRKKAKGGLSWREMLFGPNSMVPNWRDAQDLVGSLKWFTGLGPRPKYGRFTYWEKFDYFAVFWGVFVIGSTGLLLWFPELFTRIIPGSLLNVATIIHSDEALLATGFIFTVHFFNTHLRPEKFPMDLVVFTGRMPVEELRRDKPGEYEALVASGKLEENLGEAYQPVVIRAIKIFGWAALSTGFGITLWIIYAMVFSYR